MKSKILFIFLALTIVTAYSSSLQLYKGETNYYYGEVKTTSPDGKTPYGPLKYSLVQRTIDKQQKTITELVHQDGKEFNTRLTQLGDSNVFTAEDLSSKSFTGTIAFAGEPWHWNSWSYNIIMNDGSGKILGEGSLNLEVLETKKNFVASDGTTRVLITEVLKKISKEEYLKLLESLKK